MFNRKALKSNAKVSFKANYWRSVAAGLVSLIAAGGAFIGSYNLTVNNTGATTNPEVANQFANLTVNELFVVFGSIAAVFGIFCILSSIIKIFLWNPLGLGANKFFLKNTEEGDTKLNTLGDGFKVNYLRNVGTLFLRTLYTTLWSLLLVVPGIVKSYSYRMVPYILADRPELNHKEAITLSRQMMRGNKWNSFKLDLSFLGWKILDAFTLGILGIFYVNPYIEHTDSELYFNLKGAVA